MMTQKKRTTIREIAKAAGVSPATASRVLSQADYTVSPALRQKVIYAAEEFGFFLKENAGPKQVQKNEIGMIVPNFSNPYFWQIAMGVESEACLEGVSVYLCNSLRNVEQETKYMRSLFNKGISGILLSPISDNQAEIIALQRQGLIIVLLEQSAAGAPCGKVLFNYLKAAKMAMSHLTGNGHTKIAFISAPITHESRREIFSGYKLGLMEAGLPFRDEYVICAGFEADMGEAFYEYELGLACAAQFAALRPMPGAAFCLNDMIALGFIKGLQSSSVEVPRDVSVMGLDNIQATLISTPALTTVSQPSFEIGRLAYKMLMDAIVHKKNGDFSISVEPILVERDSVAPTL